jgi:hypothetical protein
MSAHGVSVSFRVICVLIMRAIESMCFQGLVGAVCVVRVSNVWRWSAASVVRMSGSDPICRP